MAAYFDRADVALPGFKDREGYGGDGGRTVLDDAGNLQNQQHHDVLRFWLPSLSIRVQEMRWGEMNRLNRWVLYPKIRVSVLCSFLWILRVARLPRVAVVQSFTFQPFRSGRRNRVRKNVSMLSPGCPMDDWDILVAPGLTFGRSILKMTSIV